MKVPTLPGAFERHILCLLDGGHRFVDTCAVRLPTGEWRQTASCSRCGLYPTVAVHSATPLSNVYAIVAGPVPGRTPRTRPDPTTPTPKFPHPTRRTA